jgi:hypothetical protein
VEAIDRCADHGSLARADGIRELIRECGLPRAVNTVNRDPDDPVGRQPGNVTGELVQNVSSAGHEVRKIRVNVQLVHIAGATERSQGRRSASDAVT